MTMHTPAVPAVLAMLDQAELLQLAANASAADDGASAIAYLKEAASRGDASGTTHHLLGAEYAQIGMYERATGELEAALAIDPTLSLVRLQLGLLWMTRADAAQSAIVLAPLEELAVDDPLFLFGRGLRQLARDELPEARRSLENGIARNSSNEALNADMRRIIVQIDALGVTAEPPATTDLGELERSLMLSAYTGNTSH